MVKKNADNVDTAPQNRQIPTKLKQLEVLPKISILVIVDNLRRRLSGLQIFMDKINFIPKCSLTLLFLLTWTFSQGNKSQHSVYFSCIPWNFMELL